MPFKKKKEKKSKSSQVNIFISYFYLLVTWSYLKATSIDVKLYKMKKDTHFTHLHKLI